MWRVPNCQEGSRLLFFPDLIQNISVLFIDLDNRFKTNLYSSTVHLSTTYDSSYYADLPFRQPISRSSAPESTFITVMVILRGTSFLNQAYRRTERECSKVFFFGFFMQSDSSCFYYCLIVFLFFARLWGNRANKGEYVVKFEFNIGIWIIFLGLTQDLYFRITVLKDINQSYTSHTFIDNTSLLKNKSSLSLFLLYFKIILPFTFASSLTTKLESHARY